MKKLHQGQKVVVINNSMARKAPGESTILEELKTYHRKNYSPSVWPHGYPDTFVEYEILTSTGNTIRVNDFHLHPIAFDITQQFKDKH